MSAFYEDFTEGLIPPYSLISGSAAKFSIVDDTYNALNIASATTGPVNKIRRTITSISSPTTFKWKTKWYGTLNSDDSGVILISNNNSTTGRVAWVTVRESYYDYQRRPKLFLGVTEIVANSVMLTSDVWYECTLTFVGTAYTFTLRNLATDTVINTFSGTFTPATMNTLEFTDDAALPTIATRFADILVSSSPASLSMSPVGVFQQFFTDAGVPVANGKINTYIVGTSTPLATYGDNLGITTNANPIILDEYGRVQTNIFLDDTKAYNFVVTDSSNNIITQLDNVRGINTSL